MNEPDQTALRRLLDRQAIQDCLHRYTRGVDRLDRELLLSAYHADAIDDHGAFSGSPAAFADWALPHHREHQRITYHLILNHSCDLDGDCAHSETYCVYIGVNRSGTVDVIGNRYIDRLERRDGRWAIARRVCVVEWVSNLPGESAVEPQMRAAVAALMAGGKSARDRSDISYQRPLSSPP
ncbi:MAG: nuclear transport factor 2 family protein [Nevskia sp.]|nr:nuclear transport factor 2 family protein [Nevskia sp.]